MKRVLKKHWKLFAISFFVGVFVIPVFIHCLFKLQAPISFLAAEWSAGEALAFYGVILSAVATIVGVHISINAATANYRDDIVKRSLPFMAITPVRCRTRDIDEEYGNAEQSKYEPPQFEEYLLEKLYFVIKNGRVEIAEELTNTQKQIVEFGGFSREQLAPGVLSFRAEKSIYTPLEIENVGNGAATTFSIGINNAKVPEKDRIFTLPTTLKIGQKYRIAIFSQNHDGENCGEYSVCLSYYDILGNGYEQNYKYILSEDSLRRINSCFMMDGTQQPRRD